MPTDDPPVAAAAPWPVGLAQPGRQRSTRPRVRQIRASENNR